ncbi:integrase [Streptomyces sp. SID5476]|uniref:TraSA:integrase fusion protein n=1 Tax=Streptomyces bottropensis ATCC 25435 TaxID=1054862 RepID=M3FTG7_9ACTN|nr:traSA:integrase fusion protein [Streptomyces bottropensis ATCC 25435]MZD16743.1 integrase [Streptomyces sp. SID5476]
MSPTVIAATMARTTGLTSASRAVCLIEACESVNVVSERLGHTNAAQTLTPYSHLFPDSEDKTRRAIDGAFSVPAQDHAGPVRTDDAR